MDESRRSRRGVTTVLPQGATRPPAGSLLLAVIPNVEIAVCRTFIFSGTGRIRAIPARGEHVRPNKNPPPPPDEGVLDVSRGLVRGGAGAAGRAGGRGS
jgi:hypothetical protein